VKSVTQATGAWWLWAAGSALFAALTALLSKVGAQSAPSNLATAIRTVVVLILAVAIAVATRETRAIDRLSARAWAALALSGLATGASWLCYFRALRLGPVTRVAMVDKLSVVLVLILGALLFGERVSWQVALGGAMVTAGVLLVARG
jgi:transporter family protein